MLIADAQTTATHRASPIQSGGRRSLRRRGRLRILPLEEAAYLGLPLRHLVEPIVHLAKQLVDVIPILAPTAAAVAEMPGEQRESEPDQQRQQRERDMLREGGDPAAVHGYSSF